MAIVIMTTTTTIVVVKVVAEVHNKIRTEPLEHNLYSCCYFSTDSVVSSE